MIHAKAVYRAAGARCVVGEGNVLDQGIRVNPGVVVSPRSLRF
jgi:mannose-1-phosphate guanylyltransferase